MLPRKIKGGRTTGANGGAQVDAPCEVEMREKGAGLPAGVLNEIRRRIRGQSGAGI